MENNNKQRLIQALETERANLLKHDMDVTEHDITIVFLKTGAVPPYVNISEYSLLEACIEDLDTIISDYV
jgi:hypothetical protein